MDAFATERLKGIVPFVHAADAGSFTAAARQLNLTSSAVSKSVARLEQRLGVVLFERTTRSLTLTDAGRAFHETCTSILAALTEAESAVSARMREPAGVVRLAVPASFGRRCVVPLLSGLARQYPDLRPQILFADRFVDLADEDIDLAVRIGGPPDPSNSVVRRELGRERLIFCAAPAYLANRGTPDRIDALHAHDCVVYARSDGTAMPWSYGLGDGRTARYTARPRIMAGDAEAQLAFVRDGLGIAQLATWLVRDDLQTGQLLEILPEAATDGLPLSLLWPVARQLMPKVGVLAKGFEDGLRIR